MENSSSGMMVCNFPSSLSPDGGKAQQMGILGHPSIYRHLCILNTGLVFVQWFFVKDQRGAEDNGSKRESFLIWGFRYNGFHLKLKDCGSLTYQLNPSWVVVYVSSLLPVVS
jgi:hypothetical protein